MELYLHCTICYFVPYSLSVMSTFFLFIVCLLLCIVNGQGKHTAQTTITSWSRALPFDGVKLFAFNKFSKLV